MALKTNYKDAAWSGERQYQIRALGNGYSAITDQTAYTVQVDAFGAKDINDTNAAINKLNHTTEVTLYANSWSGSSAPYYQYVYNSAFTADMEAILVSALPVGASASVQSAYAEAYRIISSGAAQFGNGNAVFYVYEKPTTNCTVGLKGGEHGKNMDAWKRRWKRCKAGSSNCRGI